MNDRGRLSASARIAFCLFAALVPLGGCEGDGPTAPQVAAHQPTRPPTAIPTATPTPTAGPLAIARFTLVPASSPGFQHAFRVRADLTETRGVGVSVTALGVSSRGGGYTFPTREGSGGAYLPAFGVATVEHLVEHNGDIPCEDGLVVGVGIRSPDGRTGQILHEFGCGDGYWPL
jgi:hypothetical protein